jgi:hypothetical protein
MSVGDITKTSAMVLNFLVFKSLTFLTLAEHLHPSCVSAAAQTQSPVLLPRERAKTTKKMPNQRLFNYIDGNA